MDNVLGMVAHVFNPRTTTKIAVGSVCLAFNKALGSILTGGGWMDLKKKKNQGHLQLHSLISRGESSRGLTPCHVILQPFNIHFH